jgi:3-phenylpropionate/cinnamic acid dioxygenase small subunit
MTSSEVQIANLLYYYAEYIDAGNFAGAAALFTHARVKVAGEDGDGTVDAAKLRTIWDRFIILYPDGTPRTKHVVTNPIIEVDEGASTATARSYYTVFQQADGLPLQPIIAGRYHDWFERVEGVWRWSFRDYSLVDLVGNMTRHGTQPVP